MNEEGYYRLDEVTDALQSAIESYDKLRGIYGDDVGLEDAA